MTDRTTRTRNWLNDLAAIIIEIDVDVPPFPQPARKRVRKLKPIWEE